MKLKYISEYLSIKQFDDIELNDFAVITGVNGAGKSHFLSAINNGNIIIEGIDPEKIVLYKNSDFNVENINFSLSHNQNVEARKKQQSFQYKPNRASQKFNENRNSVLAAFHITESYNSLIIDAAFLNNVQEFDIFNWTEEDKEYYRNSDENIQDRSDQKYSKIWNFQYFLSRYTYSKIEDIDKFVEFLLKIKLKINAFDIIKSLDFNSDFKTFNIALFNEIINIKIVNPQFDLWSEENRVKYPPLILNVTENLRNYYYDNTPTYLVLFGEIIKDVYKEMEDYFISKIDHDSLRIIQSINKDNVLDSISFGNAFFNLHDIAIEEKTYQLNIKQNTLNEFLLTKGENVNVLTSEELKQKFGESPIKILNDVLNEYDVNGYEFMGSDLVLDVKKGMEYQDVDVYLYNKSGGFKTDLDSLSSGEKTLIALAFSIFKLKQEKILVNVLLMDELDSALHPSMSKRLVNVLNNYFYKTLKIKIIISSHSPSTIAFSPDDSLYIIKKDKSSQLIHNVSKDEALKELTIGVPSFSINYENRKQVFVESKYDVEYYNALYNIFKNNLNKDISLNFIASGDVRKNSSGQGISSCDVVKEVTKTLRNAGNNSIYGIIDWDLAKSKDDNPYVITLGFESRYSIENYILDPLFIGFLLIVEKIKDYRYFDLNDKNKVSDLYSISIEECQLLINKIENDFLEQNIIKQITPKEHTTILEIKLLLSEEFATMQGHELEKNYFKVYPELNKFKGSADNHFKNHLIKKVLEEFVDYISMDLLNVFREIQK